MNKVQCETSVRLQRPSSFQMWEQLSPSGHHQLTAISETASVSCRGRQDSWVSPEDRCWKLMSDDGRRWEIHFFFQMPHHDKMLGPCAVWNETIRWEPVCLFSVIWNLKESVHSPKLGDYYTVPLKQYFFVSIYCIQTVYMIKIWCLIGSTNPSSRASEISTSFCLFLITLCVTHLNKDSAVLLELVGLREALQNAHFY